MAEDLGVSELRVALLHAFDHLVRLQGYVRPPQNVGRMLGDERLRPITVRCREMLAQAVSGLRGQARDDWLANLERNARELEERNHLERPMLLEQTASGVWNPLDALDVLDGMRWVSTVAYHTWRASNYLGVKDESAPALED